MPKIPKKLVSKKDIIAYRNSDRKKNYSKGRKYDEKNRKKWSEYDIDLVISFEGTDRELSKIINRSVQSIQIKRCRILKKATKLKKK
jgi:hypothetical protein